MQSRTRSSRSTFLFLLAMAVVSALLGPSASVAAPPAAEDDRAEERAVNVLERVQDLLSEPASTARRSTDPLTTADKVKARSLTMALRDLAMVRDDLTGADKKDAGRILARPTSPDSDSSTPDYPETADVKTNCNRVSCIHYVTEGEHASTAHFAELVERFVLRSARNYERRGYRQPMGDDGAEGSDHVDIYLVDLDNYFGYTANDELTWGDHVGSHGYIVLDRNYRDFCAYGCSASVAKQLLKATTSHEYFHAIQFGYDFAEDMWFMESTATWAEDIPFDGVNDNVAYLRVPKNVMTNPWLPADHTTANWYGNWILVRYLSERFGESIVRDMWEYAAAEDGPDQYSLQAMRNSVEDAGANWYDTFRFFADANRRPRWYDEGREERYPRSSRSGLVTLTKSQRRVASDVVLSRLSSATYRFRPARGMRHNWILKVKVLAHAQEHGGAALATIKKAGGGFKRVRVSLGPDGRGIKYVRFGTARVEWVEVTAVNASTRYDCGVYSPDPGVNFKAYQTCNGRPLDDKVDFRVVGRAMRP